MAPLCNITHPSIQEGEKCQSNTRVELLVSPRLMACRPAVCPDHHYLIEPLFVEALGHVTIYLAGDGGGGGGCVRADAILTWRHDFGSLVKRESIF